MRKGFAESGFSLFDYGFLAVLIFIIFFPILMVFATGSTFGQRCAKAYPDSPAQQEWCVKRVSKGGLVYPNPPEEEKISDFH